MRESSSSPTLERILVGQPIPSHLAHHERLSRVTGLAVLSSDALSSVAYATDFIVATLIVAGTGALQYAIPISVVITTLLAIVAFSYWQTIFAYPTGGGAYRVAKENIGVKAGLVAAASLLVDYTLTVSVSIFRSAAFNAPRRGAALCGNAVQRRPRGVRRGGRRGDGSDAPRVAEMGRAGSARRARLAVSIRDGTRSARC